MGRLESWLLLAWWALLLLLAVFNWTLLSRTEAIGFLFMTFEGPWGLWLIALAASVPALIRGLAWIESRAIRRTTEGEITRLKARAFDERSGELETFATAVQERVERAVRGALKPGGPDDAPKP